MMVRSAMKRLVTIFLFLATPQDVTSKAFTFGGSVDSYIRVEPTINGNITRASVCLRFFSDLPDHDRWQTLFSLATPTFANGLTLFKYGRNRYSFYIGDQVMHFWGLPDELNSWNSVCATWDSTTGLAQVWVNNKPGSRKFGFKGGSLTGTPTPIVILGVDRISEQDWFGGWFKHNKAFMGQLRDLHMWDHVISSCKIRNYSQSTSFGGGNLINWYVLTYTMYGNVEEDSRITQTSFQARCGIE